MKRWLGTLAVFAAVAAAGCKSPAYPAAAVPPPEPNASKAGPAASSRSYVGVFEEGAPLSYTSLDAFAKRIGRQPNLVVYYSGWNEKFQAAFAMQAHFHGAIPLVQINPTNVSMADIAAGRYDAYIRSYADHVRSYRYPVIIGFAHEMNGSWYSWGYRHTSPATWVRAWRHVVTVFRRQGATNVTWLWTVDRQQSLLARLPSYWPGSAYVTWVGIDGYYFQRSDIFDRVFMPAIREVRTFSHKPILISETAAAPAAGKATKVEDLFAGVIRHRLLGLVWFDVAQHGGLTHQNWRIEGNRPAVTAFRRGAATLRPQG
jgi:Glycosyl hydrolase family 26